MTVKEFAKKQGYVDALPLGKWHGYDAYEPVFDGDIAYVGPPLMILAKGNEMRMSTPEEGYQQMDGK
jgi:hypothetical protein